MVYDPRDVADGQFDCEECSENVSFGASECAACGTRYQYVSGRPVAEGEQEQQEQAPKAPATPFQYPLPVEAERPAFAPSKTLAAALILALCASVTMNGFGVMFNVLLMEHMLEPGSLLASHTDFLIELDRMLEASIYTVYLGAGLLFLLWIHAASRSARALGARRLHYTPRTVVLWWFIPIACMIAPYRATAELWRVSHARSVEDWRSTSMSAVMPTWWALWILSVATDRIKDVNGRSAAPSESAPIVAALVDAAAAFLAAWIVLSIQRGLMEKVEGASR